MIVFRFLHSTYHDKSCPSARLSPSALCRPWGCNSQGAILIELMELYDDRAEYMKDHWNVLDVLAFVFCGSAFIVRVVHPDSLWGRALYAAGASVCELFCIRFYKR